MRTLLGQRAITLPGDSVSFDWQATGGSDAYDVIGYLVDETTGEVQELLNETGATTSASTNWATVTQAVSKQGSYKFVFVAGTWDASGGTAAGANHMWITLLWILASKSFRPMLRCELMKSSSKKTQPISISRS